MHLSRFMISVPTTLLAPLLVLALGVIGGCQPQHVTQHHVTGKSTLNCDTTITVTPGAAHGVDKDVYVCEDAGFNQVRWVAPAGVTFTVQFLSTSSADCPFSPCPQTITDSTPQTVGPQPSVLTVYKYQITVKTGANSTFYDPHVVGGGGY